MALPILLAVGVFTGVTLLLVLLLELAERKLVRAGTVRLLVNDDEERSLEVPAGGDLLSTLADRKIYLPSACGGGGTCALCKCRVLEGGGDVLPTELGHLSRDERKRRVRLACQVKVRTDMRIEVPPSVFEIRKYACVVRSNRSVATFIKELDLALEGGQRLEFQPGGYVQVDIPPHDLSFREFDIPPKYRGDWERLGLFELRSSSDEEVFRAYSMANHPAEGSRVTLDVRIATPPAPGLPPGKASSYLFGLKPGDKAVVSGPFGEFHIKDTAREMAYIGGGAGMAPLRSHIFHLFRTLKTKRKVSYWYGARSLREVFYEEEFRSIEKASPNFSFHLALSEPLPEDDWKGPTGFIHQVVLDRFLKAHPDPTEVEYYLCGPPPMVQAVRKMLDGLGVEKEMIAFDAF